MVNLHQFIKGSEDYRKLEVNELTFVEYTCSQEETKFGIWSDANYFAFVLSGKKSWKTIHDEYIVEHGDVLFIKKGANLTHQYFDDTFCAIFLFIPDDFIRGFMQKHPELLTNDQKDLSGQDAVLKIQSDSLIESYAQSISAYLMMTETPTKELVIHKFEELLFSLFSNNQHVSLTDYFVSLCQSREYHMTRVMEENYGYNLKLEDYAELCHMSLSAFKKAFKDYYKTTPGSWVKDRKLELALNKIKSSDLPVNQISLECGFEDPSHFIRVFKEKYEFTPHQYRQKHIA